MSCACRNREGVFGGGGGKPGLCVFTGSDSVRKGCLFFPLSCGHGWQDFAYWKDGEGWQDPLGSQEREAGAWGRVYSAPAA